MSEHQSDPISDDELDPDHPYNVPAVARTDIHGQPIPESAPSDVTEVLSARPELGEVALFRMANGSKFVVLQDQTEATWLRYCRALRNDRRRHDS